MRYKTSILRAILLMGIGGLIWEKIFASPAKKASGSFYDFTMMSLTGEPISFARYRGKNLLVVNTASQCGYTPQYRELQKLHEMYGDRLTVLGFPANDFLWQEPGTNEDIAAFCKKNYRVTFQMFAKISVKGRHQHPLYKWLAAASGQRPRWNFCKYFVTGNGEVTGYFGPKVSPLDPCILNLIAL